MIYGWRKFSYRHVQNFPHWILWNPLGKLNHQTINIINNNIVSRLLILYTWIFVHQKKKSRGQIWCGRLSQKFAIAYDVRSMEMLFCCCCEIRYNESRIAASIPFQKIVRKYQCQTYFALRNIKPSHQYIYIHRYNMINRANFVLTLLCIYIL